MQTFLLHIEDSRQIALFQLLAQQLGLEMNALEDEIPPQHLPKAGPPASLALYYPIKTAYNYEDILGVLAQFPEDKKWTFSELQDESIFPETQCKKQLIANQLYVMPNPSTLHQKIVVRASRYLDAFVDEHNLGDVYVAPVSVKIDEDNALEPDIIFISVSKREGVGLQAIHTPPDLVVEVISPANYKKLREEKKALYADFGVSEYWEIYPKAKRLKIEILSENEETHEKEYRLFSEAQETGLVHSRVLEGFSLDVEKIFRQ
ncbi:MAG: hypothetical protein OHK0053_11690 [Microscillaceae bacterium]